MEINIKGSLELECQGEVLTIEGSEFSLEEDGTRNLGDGDFQYEALHIYFDPDQRFKILVQSSLLDGHLTIHPAQVEEGEARILEDDLEAVEA
ncbi:hypothetical protein [Pandoraea apista]|uniref:hypothetical protein n=1 Tax=Pandoraea apista TaxID=93218 RepID=UPI00248E418D|nr:hypothetical protein [Pandoraea apista]